METESEEGSSSSNGSVSNVYARSFGCKYTSMSTNWTYMSDLVSGAAGLFPSFVTLIVNAVPILIILAVVGFIVDSLTKYWMQSVQLAGCSNELEAEG